MSTLREDRHPATQQIAQWFEFDHLGPGAPRRASFECAALADWMIDLLPDGPELTVGLRKLLEAKDCFVRAAIEAGHNTEAQGAGAGTDEPKCDCEQCNRPPAGPGSSS